MATALESNAPVTNPGGLAGKRIAIWFGACLLLVVVGLGIELWVYKQLEQTQEDTRAAWRTLASELSLRQLKVQRVVAEGIDSNQIPIELGERFRLAIDAFGQSSVLQSQVVAAREIESVAQSIMAGSKDLSEPFASKLANSLTVSPKLKQSAEEYNAVVDRSEKVRSSLGGKILLFFIKLAKSPEFKLLSGRVD